MPELSELTVKTIQCSPNTLNRASFRYIDISSVDRLTKQIVEAQPISVKEAPSRARKSVRINDVLVSTVRPNLNAVARVPVQYNNEIASTGFCVLRANPKLLDATYLFYFVQTEHFVNRLTELSTGAGYPAVSDGDILDTELNLPPLPEQQRLAALLDKADHLRRTRRYARLLSDTFLQSVFLEMFGDPATNPKGWDIVTLADLCAEPFANGVTLSQESIGSGNKLVNISDLYESAKIDTTQLGRATVDDKQLKKAQLKEGDIIFVRSSVKREGGAMCAYFPGDAEAVTFGCFNIRFRPDLRVVNPAFMTALLRLPEGRRRLLAYCQTSTITNINQDNLGLVKVVLPPIPLQEQFAQVVRRTERLRGQQREAARQAEHLFQTLLARAFRGEV